MGSQSLHGNQLKIVMFHVEWTQIILICKDLHSKDLRPPTVFICHHKPENKSRVQVPKHIEQINLKDIKKMTQKSIWWFRPKVPCTGVPCTWNQLYFVSIKSIRIRANTRDIRHKLEPFPYRRTWTAYSHHSWAHRTHVRSMPF